MTGRKTGTIQRHHQRFDGHRPVGSRGGRARRVAPPVRRHRPHHRPLRRRLVVGRQNRRPRRPHQTLRLALRMGSRIIRTGYLNFFH